MARDQSFTLVSKISKLPRPGDMKPPSSPADFIAEASIVLDRASHSISKSDHEGNILKNERAAWKEPVSHMHPHYISAHCGEPCTLGALDHLLQCGHKVITTHPEHCAKNCCQPQSKHVDSRNIDDSFVCMQCITEKLRDEHSRRTADFCAELKPVAKATGKKNPQEWISQKIRIVEIAWRDLEIAKMTELAEKGRFCQALYVHGDYHDLVIDILAERRQLCPQIEAEAANISTPEESDVQDGGGADTPSRVPAKSSSLESSSSKSTNSPGKVSRLPKPRTRI